MASIPSIADAACEAITRVAEDHGCDGQRNPMLNKMRCALRDLLPEGISDGADIAFHQLVTDKHLIERERDDANRNNRETALLYAKWRSRAERAESLLAGMNGERQP